IRYLIEITIFQFLFLVVYELFLKRETFFRLNRVYLLFTPALSLVLPLVKIGILQQVVPANYSYALPSIFIDDSTAIAPETGHFPWWMVLGGIWIFGSLLSTGLFLWKLSQLENLKRRGMFKCHRGYDLITLPQSDTAFSFGHTIFVGNQINNENKANIIRHEKIHLEEKHGRDLLFFEFLRIMLWFDPFIYIYQNRIACLHEFIADKAVANYQKDQQHYHRELLSEVFGTTSISFANTFYKESLIKKRLTMLRKTNSTSRALLKYLLILPLLG